MAIDTPRKSPMDRDRVVALPGEGDHNAMGILVLDSHDDTRQSICTVLENAGFTTRPVADAAEASRLIDDNRPTVNLLLLELMADEATTPNSIDQITRLRPEIPWICVTTDIQRDDFASRFDVPPAAILNKPVVQHILLETIAKTVKPTRNPGTQQSVETASSFAPPHAPSELPDGIIDFTSLSARCCHNDAFVLEMLTVFRNDLTERLDRLSTHVASNDLNGFKEEAHGLRGAAGAICAQRIQRIAHAMESSAVSARSIDMSFLLNVLRREREYFLMLVSRPGATYCTTDQTDTRPFSNNKHAALDR